MKSIIIYEKDCPYRIKHIDAPCTCSVKSSGLDILCTHADSNCPRNLPGELARLVQDRAITKVVIGGVKYFSAG
jgi:hypothetical protein